MLCNSDYTIIESNKAANVVFGKGDTIVGTKCFETYRNTHEPCSDCPLPETIESGTLLPIHTYDERLEEYLEERTHPIMSDNGDLEGFVLITRNVTKTREIENKFAQAKKLAAIGQISSGVAHDFNNVLAGVLGRIQIMKKNITEPDILKDLNIIEKAAQDGAQTVRRIQDFTRAKSDIPLETVNLKQSIEDVVALTHPKWRESTGIRGTIIEVNLDLEDNLYIMGNPSGLDNTFTNLIFNAVDAMPDGGVLSISTERDGQNVTVRFKDTGIGMTGETKERIFDPFFTTKGVRGSGLGMSEVFGVVKRHEGKIEVESEVGKGATITISFPLTEKVEVEVVPEEIYEYEPSKILVIDDEEYVLDAIKDLLTESGHEVAGFTSAEEALEHFPETDFDIVITDLGMPDISGQDVAERIKAMNRNTPVILLSGWSVNLEEEKDLGKVVDFAITKPFSVEDIQEVLSRALDLSRKSEKGKISEKTSTK